MFFNNKNSQENKGGKVNYNRSIVDDIISHAIAEIDGIASDDSEKQKTKNNYLPNIKLDFDNDNIYVDISFYVYYGYSVPEVACKVQESVKTRVETMTRYKIKDVNVRVLDVLFKEDVAEAEEIAKE